MNPLSRKSHSTVYSAMVGTLLLVSSSAAQANWICDKIFIGNRPYRPGETVKSPMKVDPLLTRVYKNTAFFLGMIRYPLASSKV